ncbi:VirD4-like conjugal transfer protein, CD1115 family, partial [Leifsonia shinshuensis]|uniref:VirD4-like conjugal transfer protein, CD1115 family n=1 Tax=Leifsonia shinshuensis TaxID=150026 RepID=UPI0035EA61C7
EESYFAAIMLDLREAMPKEKHSIKSVLQIGTIIGQDEEKLDEMFEQLPEHSEAVQMYNIFKLAQDRTRAGILIGFGTRLRLWVSKEVAHITSKSDFDLKQLGQKKTALFLLIPDKDRTFDLIPALIIDQLFNVLYTLAGDSPGRRLPVNVRLLLDEAANIAQINDFEVKVSTMRSRGISVIPIYQNITQFKNRYDRERWSEIIGSIDTIVYLGSNDPESNQYFSKKLGKKTMVINSVSESKNNRGQSSSKSYSTIGRELMQVDELERLPKDEAIVFQAGMYPMRIKKHLFFKQKKWKHLHEVSWQDDIHPRNIKPVPLIDPFETNTSSQMEVGTTIQRDEETESDFGQEKMKTSSEYLSSLMDD